MSWGEGIKGEKWTVVFKDGYWWSLCASETALDRFKHKENAVLDVSLYKASYHSGRHTPEGTLCQHRVDIWECILKIFKERGIEM